jgi:hypothetical protein
MIVVDFNHGLGGTLRLARKDLAINCRVFCKHRWVPVFGGEFSWYIGAVCLADHEQWFVLFQEGLFKIITQAIMVRINGRILADMLRSRGLGI